MSFKYIKVTAQRKIGQEQFYNTFIENKLSTIKQYLGLQEIKFLKKRTHLAVQDPRDNFPLHPSFFD